MMENELRGRGGLGEERGTTKVRGDLLVGGRLYAREAEQNRDLAR